MSIREEMILYAKRCVSGEALSGQKHIWACQRLLRDFERLEQGKFYWDEESAESIVDWFRLLRHSKGVLAGRPIELTDWQKFLLCQLYGWRRREDGKRRFKKAFIEVGRKNAKSQMLAGVNLYEASVTAARNGELAECYTAGTKRDQSKIIVDECKNMLKGSPLRARFKLTRDKIVHLKSGSFIKPLCKEDGQKGDGTSPAGLTLDEYHQHQTTEFYDLGLGAASKEPLLMIITTAGMDLTYPCYTQEYDYCAKVLNPDLEDIENDEYLIDILEADAEDDPGDERAWAKANPIRMSYPEGVEKLRGDYKIAQETPEKLAAFRTKCLNQWVQARENGYMDMGKWRRCRVEKIPFDLTGQPVYVGFDLSAKIDLTSVAFVLPIRAEDAVKYVVFSHSFIPSREKLRERCRMDKVPYDAWERLGYLTVTNSEIVDQNQVIAYALEKCRAEKWALQCLCFDPTGAGKLMLDLSNEGYVVEEVYQSHKSLHESTAGFREQVYCGNVVYIQNPLLTYAMSNAVIRTNGGLIKIDKDAAKKRIDPVDAVLCAFKLALYHDFGYSKRQSDAWLEEEGW